MEPDTKELHAAILGVGPEELLDPQLRKARLGGYQEEDVDDLLERCRLQLTADRQEIEQLREAVGTLQQQPHGAHASALTGATGLRVLAKAQENADRVGRDAQAQADELLAEARRQAESVLAQSRDEASTQAKEAIQAAVAEADRIKAQAPRDAEQRVARYLALAETIRTQMGALLGTWHEQEATAGAPPDATVTTQNGRARRQRRTAATQDGE